MCDYNFSSLRASCCCCLPPPQHHHVERIEIAETRLMRSHISSFHHSRSVHYLPSYKLRTCVRVRRTPNTPEHRQRQRANAPDASHKTIFPNLRALVRAMRMLRARAATDIVILCVPSFVRLVTTIRQPDEGQAVLVIVKRQNTVHVRVVVDRRHLLGAAVCTSPRHLRQTRSPCIHSFIHSFT